MSSDEQSHDVVHVLHTSDLSSPLCGQVSLPRIEPARPTEMRFDADYLQWGDYAAKCKTGPSKWFNEHPSLPAAARAPAKYPWGQWE